MAILGSVVEPSAYFPTIEIARVAHRGGVGLQSVPDDRFGSAVAFARLLDEGKGGRYVTLSRHVVFEDFALLIDGSPQIDHPAIQFDVNLIEVSFPVPEIAYL